MVIVHNPIQNKWFNNLSYLSKQIYVGVIWNSDMNMPFVVFSTNRERKKFLYTYVCSPRKQKIMQQKNTIIDILTMEKCWKGCFPWWPSWNTEGGGESGIWNGHNFATTGLIFTNEGLKFPVLVSSNW
jgi:hypothetical protein